MNNYIYQINYRYPFVASEIFNCELGKINDLFFQSAAELQEELTDSAQNSSRKGGKDEDSHDEEANEDHENEQEHEKEEEEESKEEKVEKKEEEDDDFERCSEENSDIVIQMEQDSGVE